MSYPDYLWWLIPGQLAGMPRPPLEDLAQLYQAGLGGIVCTLTEPDLVLFYQQSNLAALALPIAEGEIPSVEQVQELVTFVDQIKHQGKSVAIHCTGGNHRTGTVLSAYLIAKGEDPELVMERVKQIRPTADLPTKQANFLRQLPTLLQQN